MKKVFKVLLSAFIFMGIFGLTNTTIYASTPTWPNGARFTRGVGNTCFWISSSAAPYAANIRSAANNWVHTGWDNPIYMTEVSSNYATHMDMYAKTSSQDSVLASTVAAYVSFWDSNGKLLAPKGNGPKVNYFYTEITINKNGFPSAYRTRIMIHEMGHAFGLAHSSSKKSIMYPFYNAVEVSTVQKVDNDTINLLY